MPISIERFALLRPFLYHLTAKSNVLSIATQRELVPASRALAIAQRNDLTERKRREHVSLTVPDGRPIQLRDQAPLHEGNVLFQDGWNFADLIRELNSRVFFWPGTEKGPITHGARHFSRYSDENPTILRISTRDLLNANELEPEFCRYNSGSPRCTRGKGSPRGRSTFLTCDRADFRPGQVVEVVFSGRVTLPHGTECADVELQSWSPLFED